MVGGSAQRQRCPQTAQPGQGQIKIGTEAWSAKSVDDTFIAKDTEVEIIKIDGVKAIVKPLIKN
jgi:membrane protein implicated in regulation of membrane protease activity